MYSFFSTSVPTTSVPTYIPMIFDEINKMKSSCKNIEIIKIDGAKIELKPSVSMNNKNVIAYINNGTIENFHINSQLDNNNCNINYSDILSKYDKLPGFVSIVQGNEKGQQTDFKEFTINFINTGPQMTDVVIHYRNIISKDGKPIPCTINIDKPFLLIVDNCNIIVNTTNITTPVEKFTNIQYKENCDLSSYLPSSHNILLILILIMIVGYYSGYRVVKTQ
jgi:hypothetical protein